MLTTYMVVGKESTRTDIVRVREQAQHQLTDLNLAHITLAVEYEDDACAMQGASR